MEKIDAKYNFRGKYVIVTGAGEGIGKATVEKLIQNNAKVICISNLKKELEIIKNEFTDKVITFICEVSNELKIKKIFSKINKYDIIGIVNSAGIYMHKDPIDLNKKDWNKIVDNNAYSVLLCSLETIKLLKPKNKKGSIVNLSSIKAIRGQGLDIPYSVSKNAIDSITRDLATYYGKYNIRTNAILPGHINTKNNLKHLKDFQNNEEDLINFFEKVPLKRGGESEEIANLVIFLLSDESSYINGSSIIIDGGYSNSL